MKQKLLNNGKNIVKRNEKGQLLPGQILNPNGKPPGTRNFITDFDEAVEEIAKLNNITVTEARKILLKKAYSEAKNGNFNFYKDIVDRYYGTVSNSSQNLTINLNATIENPKFIKIRERLIKEFNQADENI